jgi:hypothetical protein
VNPIAARTSPDTSRFVSPHREAANMGAGGFEPATSACDE